MSRQTWSDRRALRRAAERTADDAQQAYRQARHGTRTAAYRLLVKARALAMKLGPVRRLQ